MKNNFFLALLCAALLCAQTAPALGEGVVGIERPYEVTQKQTVIETERYRMSIEAGVYVPQTIKEDVELVMDTAEQVTGLTFYPETPVHPSLGKVQIDVLNPELHDGNYEDYGLLSGVTVSSPDIVVWGGQGWALLHELLHCLQFRNGSVLSTTLAEGFATTHVLKAASTAPFPIAFDSYFNYAGIETQPNEKNAQALFLDLDKTKDAWNYYLYGFPMVLFMNEEYGEETFLKLIKLPKDDYSVSGEYVFPASHKNAEMLPYIKAAASDDFFTRFGAWYQKNSERLNPSNSLIFNDYARFERVDVFPQCFISNYYDSICTQYSGSLTLDYTTGNRYLAEYKHIAPLGFSGTISAQGQSTFAFYSQDGALLKTVELNGSSETLFVQDAGVIQITGDGRMIQINADFDAMTLAS